MSNKAFVSFDKLFEEVKIKPETRKELMSIEAILNLTPSVKQDGKYVASPTNISVMSHVNVTVSKVASMVEQGLSYSNGDYYIYVQFGGKPSVTKTPNGIIRAISNLASLQGYIANINTGCIFEGYEHLRVKRNGLFDKLELVNNAMSEVGKGKDREQDILAPFAVITLIDRTTNKKVSSKVTIIRQGEYTAAKAQGSYTHKTYPVPMAEKIALKRAGEQMAAMLGLDDSAELDNFRQEIKDHNAEYSIGNESSKKEGDIEDQIDAFADNTPKKVKLGDV